jgi:predicted enzyme related to lactoylglutathione lyase
MSDSTVRGRFVWHELLTTDTKSAGAFFSKVIGWKAQPWGEDASYTLFVSGDRQMAGLMTLPEDARKMGAPPNWLTYIGAPNVDETARQATSLGATVVKAPEDIPTIGRFAVIRDPQGAVFAIFAPNRAPVPDSAMAVGDFSWHELATTDAKAALAFYQQLFGWEETSAMDMGRDLGTYHMFGPSKNGPPSGGAFNKPAQMPGPSSWLPYIKVADAKKTGEVIKKLRGKIVNGPTEVPGGDWIAQGLDLQGAMFAVHSVKPAASSAPASVPPKAAVARKAPAKSQGAAKRKGAAKSRVGTKSRGPATKKKAASVRKMTPTRSATKRAATKKAAVRSTGRTAKKTAKTGKASKGTKSARRR